MTRPGLIALATVGWLIALLVAVVFALPPYRRADWPHWRDVPGRPCVSVRQAVLARDALPGTVQWSPEGCFVLTGQWRSPYSGALLTNPADLDVDHRVPLGEAHRAGGWRWSRDDKREYANSLRYRHHLVAVEASLNRAKGDQGPDRWRPREGQCRYAETWALTKVLWGLTVSDDERAALWKLAETC